MKVFRSPCVLLIAAMLVQARVASAQYQGTWTQIQAPIRVQDALLLMDGRCSSSDTPAAPATGGA